MKKALYIAECAALAAADQALKSYVEQNMEQGEERPIKGRFVLRSVRNKGMCLNLLQEKPKLVKRLSAAAALAVTVLQAASLLRKGRFLRRQGFALISAGAWSNTFDRWTKDGVVDYIGIKCGSERLSQITYNLADFYIFAGSAVLTAASFFPIRKRKNVKKGKSVIS